MPKVAVYNVSGQQVSEMELSENIFAVEVNQFAIYEVVKNHLANRRQGTQSAKTRSEVRGGGRKPWRQKGTGRARAGTIRSPLWVGGGTVFAPKPRDYRYTVPKKVRRLAMKSALTSKVNSQDIIVLDELAFDAPKTKQMVSVLNNLKVDKKVLIVIADNNEAIVKSASNIPGVQTASVNTLNVYDIVNYDKFIITKDAVQKVEEVYA
ncbi:50S ribosomal protein L4 [Serpentinicella alkaliphila]|uniref:Large ribosomal subunit protein uL4 n=1 Tax=Serpentinicella alkaliphila TaxID=1734049 RepID=A0A4R2TVI0_9FIRM|nr:50S ribosomal protein L4 [Serpentinicella alkaliphila]QUH25440.1 50S ribosomal protein L4 [Serpentinicella alkaliphila]TCQ01639.1 large subunit ribosomal protein L4 [Serpentinicella alkaliphila]